MRGTNWYELWYEDKKSIIVTMARNITADIEAGYSPTSNTILKQWLALGGYKAKFDEQLARLVMKTPQERNRWCYADMKKRGVI